MLNLLESFELLKKLPLARYVVVKSEQDLSKMALPYFMKACSPIHKTEQNAVRKCNSEREAAEHFRDMKNKFPGSEILIQGLADGVEIIIGLKEDKTFGRLLMVGFGGIFAETMKDVSFRAVPIDKREIRRMIEELRLYPMLVTRKKYAVDRLVALAEQVSKIDVKELDLNPVMLNEKEALIVDARVEPK